MKSSLAAMDFILEIPLASEKFSSLAHQPSALVCSSHNIVFLLTSPVSFLLVSLRSHQQSSVDVRTEWEALLRTSFGGHVH